MPRCPGCPIAGDRDQACVPAKDWPGWCGRIAGDAHQPEGARYWAGALIEEDDKLAGHLPPGFPSPKSAVGRRISVGLACPVLYPAGAEAHMMSLIKTIDPARVAWRGLAVLNGERTREAGISARFAELLPLADGKDAALALARSCDVIVAWDIGDLPREIKALNPRCRVVLVSHAPIESDWGRKTMARIEGVDRVVSVSELATAVLPVGLRDDPAVSSVIWNAVDVSRLAVTRSRAEMHGAWGIPAGSRVAGYYGRMSPEKDPEALGRMIGHLPGDWHAVVVGQGWTRDRVEEAARSSNGGAGRERIHFVGVDHRAGDVLGGFDVLVNTSDFESFGLTMAEGCWAGVPVISTRVGFIKVLLDGGEMERVGPLTSVVDFKASGEVLAKAVLDDSADIGGRTTDRVARARAFARERLAPEAFGRAWTDLIVSVAPERAVVPAPLPASSPPRSWSVANPSEAQINARLSVLRNECPHAAKLPGCGCGGEVGCGLGKGSGADPGRASIADCRACLKERHEVGQREVAVAEVAGLAV